MKVSEFARALAHIIELEVVQGQTAEGVACGKRPAGKQCRGRAHGLAVEFPQDLESSLGDGRIFRQDRKIEIMPLHLRREILDAHLDCGHETRIGVIGEFEANLFQIRPGEAIENVRPASGRLLAQHGPDHGEGKRQALTLMQNPGGFARQLFFAPACVGGEQAAGLLLREHIQRVPMSADCGTDLGIARGEEEAAETGVARLEIVDVVGVPHVVQHQQRGLVLEEGSQELGACFKRIETFGGAAQSLRGLAHLADQIRVGGLFTHLHPQDSVGEGGLDSFVTAQRLRQNRLADAAHAAQRHQRHIAALAVTQHHLAQRFELCRAGDEIRGEGRNRIVASFPEPRSEIRSGPALDVPNEVLEAEAVELRFGEVAVLTHLQVHGPVCPDVDQHRDYALAVAEGAELLAAADFGFKRARAQKRQDHICVVERLLDFPRPVRAALEARLVQPGVVAARREVGLKLGGEFGPVFVRVRNENIQWLGHTAHNILSKAVATSLFLMFLIFS